MATLTQQPNAWNLSYIPNVYILDGLGLADRYVLSVYIDGNPVATFNQTANPAGVGIFDVQRVLQSYLNSHFVETTQVLSPTIKAALGYQVRYGTDTNGIITWDALTAEKFVINGYANWRDINWDYTDFIPDPTSVACENENIGVSYSRSYEFLTNWPTYSNGLKTRKVRSDEWQTYSFFNRILDWNDGTMWGANETPFFLVYNFYNTAGTLIQRRIETITSANGLGNRTDCNDFTSSINDIDDVIGTIGVGPQNIKDAGWWPALTASYDISLYSRDMCFGSGIISDCGDFAELEDYLGDLIYKAAWIVEDPCTPFEPITMSFANQYGVKDYYTFDRRNTKTVATSRNTYTKNLGTWSQSTYSIDPEDRGKLVFSSDITTQMTLSSYWMSDAESKWLQELFSSQEALIYVDGLWEPVIITTVSYQEKTYNRDRMFQHEIQVEFANKKRIQRG